MTEQPNPNELLLITREELERCCSQMSAAGYKVSANYVEASVLSRSRPATAQIDLKKCFDDLAYATGRWKIYRQDAGMGEVDYCVLRNDDFFCRANDLDIAKDICAAYDKKSLRNAPTAQERDTQ